MTVKKDINTRKKYGCIFDVDIEEDNLVFTVYFQQNMILFLAAGILEFLLLKKEKT